MPNTREKLIELLSSDYCPLFLVFGDSMYSIVDYLIANGVTVQQWIPVTERLPDLELEEVKTDDNDLFPCLVARTHTRAKNGKYTAKVWYDGYGFIDGLSVDVTEEVTHWMPLPEPPEGE